MKFIQIVDFETERVDEMRGVMGEWDDEAERRDYSPTSSVLLKDRDNPNRYYAVVTFNSYDEAMRNSDDPRTSEMAGRLEALCTRPTKFVNCDVLEEYPS
ncbi:hypothetical protein [Streptomyces sp. TRM64462]|uniref:hypothetical protein n=1 Tax=Streptomyces sp. TRM64462 TaxID=2741726 RepID=UPI0015867E04|nr:hypothetical protein [Streptomyces sp. TRM64462]